ncbi:hypothetical protein D3C71_1368550 [compost metagenome]
MGQAGHAADVDDRRGRVPRQQRVRIARQFERRKQVGLEDPAPLVFGVFGGRLADVAAGIVDQDVQAIAVVFHPVQDFAAVLVIGDVGSQAMDLTIRVGISQFIAGHLQRIRIAADDQQVRTEAQQFARDRQADAGTRTGDQCGLSIQSPTLRAHVLLLR